MVDHHPMPSRRPPVNNEDRKSPAMEEVKKTEEKDEDIDDIPYLCGKPFFDVVLTKSHVNPRCYMRLPVAMGQILPRATVPVVLRYDHKNWDASYVGRHCQFDSGWWKFVSDNKLTVGDGCVFELLENNETKIKFKVHILRGELPPELLQVIDSCGTLENPFDLD